MPDEPVRPRRQADRPKFRGMVKGGRVVWSDRPDEFAPPVWPVRALVDPEGRIVWAKDES